MILISYILGCFGFVFLFSSTKCVPHTDPMVQTPFPFISLVKLPFFIHLNSIEQLPTEGVAHLKSELNTFSVIFCLLRYRPWLELHLKKF